MKKNKKNALITFSDSISLERAKDYERKMQYDKVFVITKSVSPEVALEKKFKKLEILPVNHIKEIASVIKHLQKNYQEEYTLLPYFLGDAKMKYAISMYNDLYSISVPESLFREKDEACDFLGEEITKKKSTKMSYDHLQELSYQEAVKEVGTPFIIKPTNAHSSFLSFRIDDEEDFLRAQKKVKKSYSYLLENYLTGVFRQIDYFFDGERMFLLSYSLQKNFADLFPVFSKDYHEKYGDIHEDFAHFLPVRYPLSLEKISSAEKEFFVQLQKKLAEVSYVGFGFVEYKYNKKTGVVGFIEWAARFGWKRWDFVRKIHGFQPENIPYEVLVEKNFRRFKEQKGLWYLQDRNIDKNYIGIKTCVTGKTHLADILYKIPNYLSISFEDFLKKYLWDEWRITIKSIEFIVKTCDKYYLYPFFEKAGTRFDYILEMDEDSFLLFQKKQNKILEKLVFHEY